MNRKTQTDRNRGSALVTMMIVLLLVCLASAALTGFARQQTHAITRIRDYMKAQAYAEAGVHDAYSVLKANWAARENDSAFPMKNYADGSYDPSVTPIGQNLVLISAVGRCNRATATAKADARNYGGTAPGSTNATPSHPAYGYAVVSGGQMTWNGNGLTRVINGKIHSNNKLKLTGGQILQASLVSSSVEIWSTGNTELRGNAAAPAWQGKSPGNITGTAVTGPVPLVPLPPLDLTPYYNHALANGQVYNGNQHFMGSGDLAPAGGIMWVNGNFKWSGSGRLIGCFIATGNIEITGSGDQIKVQNFPALVSRDGDIDISGSGSFHGLIYAMSGKIDKSGAGPVVGSMISAGVFDKSGNWDLLTYEDSTPTPPNVNVNPGSGSDLVGITAWQK